MSALDNWQIPLLVSAVAFLAFLVFKMRPAVSSHGRASAAALKEAKKRVADAKDDEAKAAALADAAEACAKLGRTSASVGFWMRAMRAQPHSKQIVERASSALAKRPSALEGLLWRQLGAEAWEGDARPASLAALRALKSIYERKPRHHPRARAIEHALAALDAKA